MCKQDGRGKEKVIYPTWNYKDSGGSGGEWNERA